MANNIKEQSAILEKLKIYQLNPMQEKAIRTIDATKNTILLSPTGTGKTLAFLLPLIKNLDVECKEVQAKKPGTNLVTVTEFAPFWCTNPFRARAPKWCEFGNCH